MLRAERDHGRFAHQVWQPLLVTRREPIVASGNNVVQLVQWIAARTPGLAFLVCHEKVAMAVKREGVRNADACGNGFQSLRPGRPPLNRAALPVHVVMRNAVLHSIRVGIVGCHQSEVHIARCVQRDRCCVHATRADIGRRPAARHDLFDIRLPISIGIAKQGNLAVRRDVKPILRPRHPDRHAQCGLVPERRGCVFQALSIRVAQEPYVAAVTERGQAAIRREAEVVDVRKTDRQFLHGEAGHQHPEVGLGRTSQNQIESGERNHNLNEAASHPKTLFSFCATSNLGIKSFTATIGPDKSAGPGRSHWCPWTERLRPCREGW